jgi:hypothetical protein
MTNCDASSIADGFCIQAVEEGQVIKATVSGRLRDASLPGNVFESVSLCGGDGGADFTTAVRPFSTLDRHEPGRG